MFRHGYNPNVRQGGKTRARGSCRVCIVAGVIWSDECCPGPSGELSVWFNRGGKRGSRGILGWDLPNSIQGCWWVQGGVPSQLGLGPRKQSHKATLISLSPGSSGKWKTNGMWIPSVCFTLENEHFPLAELLKAGASHSFLTELSSGLPKAEYINYLYCQTCISIKHGIRLFCSCGRLESLVWTKHNLIRIMSVLALQTLAIFLPGNVCLFYFNHNAFMVINIPI